MEGGQVAVVDVGPAWTQQGSGRYAGRYPLAVERHLINQIDRLLPGVTTVTPHGRYYAAHGLIAHEAKRRDLADIETWDLLRRVEVALGAVSTAHSQAPQHEALNRAHGADVISVALQNGGVTFDVAAGHGAGRYAKAATGFLGPYRGAEMMMGILDQERVRPGPKFSADQVLPALGGLLDLASRDYLTTQEAIDHVDLCVCQGADASDGQWLTDLLIPTGDVSEHSRAGTRKATVRMFTRAIDVGPVGSGNSLPEDLGALITFGSHGETDPVLTDLAITRAWRGVFLRWYSVTAWRGLWAWLVNQIEGVTTRGQLADRFADAVPHVTVGAFMAGLPDLVDRDGHLAAAERDPSITATVTPVANLMLLGLGAQRSQHLTDRDTLEGFQGTGLEARQELGPLWLHQQLETWSSRPLPDFARHLSGVLVDRSQRLAFQKATRDKTTGALKVPTRVYLRDDWVFKDSDEGSGAVGLRWQQLATVLAEAGVIASVDRQWAVTERGRDAVA